MFKKLLLVAVSGLLAVCAFAASPSDPDTSRPVSFLGMKIAPTLGAGMASTPYFTVKTGLLVGNARQGLKPYAMKIGLNDPGGAGIRGAMHYTTYYFGIDRYRISRAFWIDIGPAGIEKVLPLKYTTTEAIGGANPLAQSEGGRTVRVT
jgi:hypothetical protein